MHQRCTVKTSSHYYIVTTGKNKTRRIILKTPDVQCNDRNIRCSVIDCNPLLTRKSRNDPCGLAVCLLGLALIYFPSRGLSEGRGSRE